MFKSAGLLLFVVSVSALTREELMAHLKYKQETANTFDSRVPRPMKPIGYVAGEYCPSNFHQKSRIQTNLAEGVGEGPVEE